MKLVLYQFMLHLPQILLALFIRAYGVGRALGLKTGKTIEAGDLSLTPRLVVQRFIHYTTTQLPLKGKRERERVCV